MSIWPGKLSKHLGVKRSKPIIAFLLLLTTITFAQKVTKPLEHIDSIYTIVDQQPEFPGGMAAMGRYMSRVIHQPYIRQYHAPGRILASFVVDKNGRLRDVQVKNGIKGTGNSAFEKNITQVIQKMPRWKPGRRKGKAVSVRYNLPIPLEPE